jgi:hypothetical protein
MLGVDFDLCHTRNNYLHGYVAEEYAPGAPGRSTFKNCYSEHSEQPYPQYMQEGPSRLCPNSLVITSNGDGNLADSIGALVMNTTLGRIQFKPVIEILGRNGISNVQGDATDIPPNDTRSRIVSKRKSSAYGITDAESDVMYEVHDPNPITRAWGVKPSSPSSAMSFGITDRKHLRGGLPYNPKGYLIGGYPNKTIAENGINDGPRRVGIHDPRSEATLITAFPNPIVGDFVRNALPTKNTFNFEGWIYAFEAGIGSAKKWFRCGENYIGTGVPNQTP